MRRPPIEDIELACTWLEDNEGLDGEAESCARVAEWLRQIAWKAEEESSIRKIAREVGVPTRVARAALKRQQEDRR